MTTKRTDEKTQELLKYSKQDPRLDAIVKFWPTLENKEDFLTLQADDRFPDAR